MRKGRREKIEGEAMTDKTWRGEESDTRKRDDFDAEEENISER